MTAKSAVLKRFTEVFLHVRHKNSIPAPFWPLSLGFVFPTVEFWLHNNIMIMHSLVK
jgi:hypothetical protein